MLHVTQEDIDRGCRTSANNCPIAIAVLRRLREIGIEPDNDISGHTTLRVLGDEIEFMYRGSCFKYATTRQAQDFVCDFDLGDPVQPFSFEAKRVEP